MDPSNEAAQHNGKPVQVLSPHTLLNVQTPLHCATLVLLSSDVSGAVPLLLVSIQEWTLEEVLEWLISIKQEQHCSLFEANAINGSVLSSLTKVLKGVEFLPFSPFSVSCCSCPLV